jgi:hypothetical protein
MDGSHQTLARRTLVVLRARQHVVFFAMALVALNLAVPLLSAWLVEQRPIGELLQTPRSPLADAISEGSLVSAGLFVAWVLLAAFLRAGYIRSIVGSFRLGASGVTQFASLLVLMLIIRVIGAGVVGFGGWAEGRTGVAQTLSLAVMLAIAAIDLALLYADYIVVLAGVGPFAAMRRSLRVLLAAVMPSLLILLGFTLLSDIAIHLLGTEAASLLHASPTIVLRIVAVGAIMFVTDVALIVVYQHVLERGKLLTPKAGVPTDHDPATPTR